MSAHSPYTPSFWLSLILAGSSLLFGAYNAYHLSDKQVEHRITVVEVQQKNDAESLQRIEIKLDELAKTVIWALGKPVKN